MNYMDNIENNFDNNDSTSALDMLITDVDGLEYKDVHDMSESLCIALINYEINSVMLGEVPHRRFLDLAIMPIWKMKGRYSDKYIKITNELCDRWGVGYDDIVSLAVKYSAEVRGFVFSKFSDFMDTLNPFSYMSYDPYLDGVMILTNENACFGASAICYDGILDHIYNRLNSNFYVVPANVDNVFILPDNGSRMSVLCFASGISRINQDILSVKDFLSNNLYYYDHEKGRLDFC